MKHLRPRSKVKRLPLRADQKGEAIMDPCPGTTGWQRKLCEFKAYKGGVVY